ncbi:four helix bundle protein [Pelagicoccus mobilis]|uniref:Four helix bundle protein n=1 Tax=Pelagicoccus mobilis TaxID=415221 RepID=A0A934VP30_9BACT|nr:four helix bundle protein [Pelagicoccus mobilis]MBK1875390.1 four helix bundle protein [Pelagicoccus mobilis]
MPFSHEKLIVYQKSIHFVGWTKELLDSLPSGSYNIRNQFERASMSIPLNIAEGNGKFSDKDRCRFFQVAHGSALECAACLDVLVAQKYKEADQVKSGKDLLTEIVNLIYGLLKRFDSFLVSEEQNSYGYEEGDYEED